MSEDDLDHGETFATLRPSPNARTAQIRKFCANPPKHAETLRLVTFDQDTGQPHVLCTYTVDQCRNNGQVCLDVDGYLQEHCETEGRPITATLAWYSVENKALSTKKLRTRPKGEDPELATLGIDGTPNGLVTQVQRHHEHMMRSYLGAHQFQLENAFESYQKAVTELAQLRAEHDTLRREYFGVLREIAESAGQAEASATPLTDEARAEVLRSIAAQVQFAGPLAMAAIAKHMGLPFVMPPVQRPPSP